MKLITALVLSISPLFAKGLVKITDLEDKVYDNYELNKCFSLPPHDIFRIDLVAGRNMKVYSSPNCFDEIYDFMGTFIVNGNSGNWISAVIHSSLAEAPYVPKYHLKAVGHKGRHSTKGRSHIH